MFPDFSSALLRLRLSEQGLEGFHKQKKPLLTPNHIRKRLDYALSLGYLTTLAVDWSLALPTFFCQEKKFV